MKNIWYILLEKITGLVGGWFFALVSRIIAAGFFLFSANVKESIRFYSRVYPEKKRLFHTSCAFQQYQNFTTIHYDRFLSAHGQAPVFQSRGWERLETTAGDKGAILLMSHLGNWEMAANLLKQQKTTRKLLLYMGVKEKEGLEGMQKSHLKRAGVEIIGIEKDGGSPFDAVAGIRLLEEGGLVSMTGDIVWRADQRQRQVDFLGGKAFVPEAPYVFALVSGAPIFCFFTFRTGKNSYRFTLAEPIVLQCAGRNERDQCIQAAAQQYAALLEQQLLAHPMEWYHFDRFVH